MTRVAIYTIAKNEEANASQFMDSCHDADLVVVGDTGSTDQTREIIQDRGGKIIRLNVEPFRFDVPRNSVLSVLPPNIDLCIALDLDEVLMPGWREQIETYWNETHDRLRFRYVHSFNPDGSYACVGVKDFGHSRHNYMWRHIVHESLYYLGPKERESVATLPDMVVEHRRDPSRETETPYLEMLKQECESPTGTPRHIFWLARDFLRAQNWEAAMEWFEKFLAEKGIWHIEKAHALRWLAKAQAHSGRHAEALATHYKSIEASPREREVWLDLGWYHQGREQ